MDDDFLKKMESLNKPDLSNVKQPQQFKLVLINAKKSAALGFWFIVVPVYFLFCVFMKYYFHVNLHLFDVFIDMMSDLDKNPSSKFLSPLLFVGLPVTAIVINALSIIYVEFNKATKELNIVIKLKWLNIAFIAISTLMVCIFILYVIVENAHHSAIPSYH